MKIAASLHFVSTLSTVAVGTTALAQGLSGLERARALCDGLPSGRREACLHSLPDPVRPPLANWQDSGVGPRAVERGVPAHHGLVNRPTDMDMTMAPREHARRNVEVTALEHGALDLAIPVLAPGASTPSSDWTGIAAANPTTLVTVTTTVPPHLGAITIADTLFPAPTTAFPYHRTLQTATLANGTEIRIEQTESRVHDVDVEETERKEGEPEEDRVIVHVKVFVEHVRERVGGLLRRGGGGLVRCKEWVKEY